MEYVLTAEAISKKYHGFWALKNLSMNVPKGSIYGFVGRNGAGKTTLIRIISGLQNPTKGGYQLYGVSSFHKDIHKAQRRIGAVVEHPAIYGNMTARENMELQYRVLGMPSYDGINETLEYIGLGDTGKKKAANFSLGMKQRLGIAVALAGDPDFLILDEPVNGLDPQGIVEIRELILRLNREKNITVLISSHILDELSRLATHYGFIHRGSMVKEISAQELEERCRKCLRVEVSDTKLFARAMDRIHVEYEVLSDTEAALYQKIDTTELVDTLRDEQCRLISVREQDETLESYFMNLVGGEEDA